jgi:hypothetical protein
LTGGGLNMRQNSFAHTQSSYKVVEISTVTDETIEEALNVWTIKGWVFDQIHFVVRESSRRPSMAFLFFTKPVDTQNDKESKPHFSRYSDNSEQIQGDFNEIDLS